MYPGPLHLDSLELALKSKDTLTTRTIVYSHGSGYPLATLISAGFIWLAGYLSINDPVLIINFMNVFLSSLGTILFFLLLKQIFNEKTAILSCIILLLNPLILHISLYGNSQWISLILLMTGFLFFFRYLQQRHWGTLVFSALSFGLLAAARLQDFLACLVSLIAILIFSLQPGREDQAPSAIKSDTKIGLRDGILFLSVIVLTALPFYWPLILEIFSETPSDYYHIYFHEHTTESIKNFSLLHLSNQLVYLFRINSIPGGMAGLAGLVLIFKRHRHLGIIFGLLIFVPVLLGGGLLYSKPRHFLPALLFFCIPIGYFYNYFLKSRKIPNLILLGVLFLSLGINIVWAFPYIQLNHNHDFVGEYYRWISEITEPNAYIVIHSPSRYFVKHYAERQSLPVPVSTRLELEVRQRLKVSIDEKLDNNIPVYIPLLGLQGYAESFDFDDFILQNYTLIYVGERLSSDWHTETIRPNLFNNPLFRITKSSDNK